MQFQREERELELQVEGRESMVSDEEQNSGSKAWPLRQRAAVLVAGLATVLVVATLAFAFGTTGMQGVAPEPAMMEAINVLAPCKAAVNTFTPVINDALSDLKSTYKNVISVKKDGPAITIGCKARTHLQFDLQQIEGLNSGVATASCDQASATLTGNPPSFDTHSLKCYLFCIPNIDATAGITFEKPLVFTMKLKESASFCHVPKSYKQTVTLTISGLDVSTDVAVALSQGKKTKVTAASISDLKVKWEASDSGFRCKGSSCDAGSSWVEAALRRAITNSLTETIESSVNYQLEQKMPMPVA